MTGFEKFRPCSDCDHSVNLESQGLYCIALELRFVIDDVMHKNDMARCHETRDFRFACGHLARWFVPKR